MSEGKETLITEIDPSAKHFHQYITPTKSEFGRGGMLTKCHIAQKLSKLGITVHIANGRTPGILTRIFQAKRSAPDSCPQKPHTGQKKWIANSEGLEKGAVTVNQAPKQHSSPQSVPTASCLWA